MYCGGEVKNKKKSGEMFSNAKSIHRIDENKIVTCTKVNQDTKPRSLCRYQYKTELYVLMVESKIDILPPRPGLLKDTYILYCLLYIKIAFALTVYFFY